MTKLANDVTTSAKHYWQTVFGTEWSILRQWL